MYLSKLKIKNFRAIKELDVEFNEGVTILVGENNAGKTTIIDALRAILIPAGGYGSYRLTVDDFKDGDMASDIGIKVYFDKLNEENEISLFNLLAFDKEDGVWGQLNLYGGYDVAKNRVRSKLVAGHELAGNVPSGVYDYVDVTYLRPLRDPATSLAESRHSCQAMYINSRLGKNEQDREWLLSEAKSVNEKLCGLQDVSEIIEECNREIKEIIGDTPEQQISFSFNEPDFIQLISDIKTLINGKKYNYNGLGLNNIIEMALLLASKEFNNDGFHIVLVEEPEAHLHPMLQRLLLSYIQKIVKKNKNKLQVIMTTHSPIFASKADIANVCHVSRPKNDVVCVGLSNILDDTAKEDDVKKLNAKNKKKLQRYLDATRGELFFSKRVIMVEGVAEYLLIPVIAQLIGYDLDKHSVTVINCLGLNFEMFIPVLERIGVRSAIITDDDEGFIRINEEKEEYLTKQSDYSKNLLKKTQDLSWVKVFCTPGTFELALFNEVGLKSLVVSAIRQLSCPKIAKKCETLSGQELYDYLFVSGRTVKKGELAQELAILLKKKNGDDSDSQHEDVEEESEPDTNEDIQKPIAELMPKNIVNAIRYVCDGVCN